MRYMYVKSLESSTNVVNTGTRVHIVIREKKKKDCTHWNKNGHVVE